MNRLSFIEPLEARRYFTAAPQKVLFIRGSSGSGGFIDGGTLAQRNEELADITNFSTATKNHGWGELANLLRADNFAPQQVIESNDQPVDLSKLNLSQYATIVFGSNNADYTPAGSGKFVDALTKYVFAGGSALFISDGNFGSSYSDAPSSDQDFLARFGLAINQDRGTYSLSRSGGDFLAANHPILQGVNQIDGEGVSPGVRIAPMKGVTPQILIRATGTTRNNDSAAKGSDRNVTTSDGTLVAAQAGLGRVAIHFDRNTFFNANGAGTDLHRFDNTRYAKNLFEWLSGRSASRPQVQAEDFQFDSSPQTLRIAFNRNVGPSLSKTDLSLTNVGTGKSIAADSVTFETASDTAVFSFKQSLSNGNYRAKLSGAGVQDSSGKSLAADAIYTFYILRGDANRDRAVNQLDVNILLANYGKSKAVFTRADFTLDGIVNSLDFTILAQSYGNVLA